jgi:SAM-dependent methyltransferase
LTWPLWLSSRNETRCSWSVRAAGERVLTHGEIFDTIYREDRWQGGSGPGSREEVTRAYRTFLQNFMRTNLIASVVDLGCGDWQIARHMDWAGVNYIGVDASAVVLQTTQKFARDGVSFIHANAVTHPLPSADLLIVKDVLQHWPNSDIVAFLPQLAKYRFALITNGFAASRVAKLNADIKVGNCRAVNLALAPFNLPGCFVFGFQADEPKWVFLWMRASAATRLEPQP